MYKPVCMYHRLDASCCFSFFCRWKAMPRTPSGSRMNPVMQKIRVRGRKAVCTSWIHLWLGFSPNLSYNPTTDGSAYRVIVGIPASMSRHVILSIIARPRPDLCQAGRTDTSQIVAENTPSLVALAMPTCSRTSSPINGYVMEYPQVSCEGNIAVTGTGPMQPLGNLVTILPSDYHTICPALARRDCLVLRTQTREWVFSRATESLLRSRRGNPTLRLSWMAGWGAYGVYKLQN